MGKLLMSSEFDHHAREYDEALIKAMPCGLDENEYFARYKIEHVAAAVHDMSAGRILDFGCGVGRSVRFLADAFPNSELHGFDPSTESIRIAIERFPAARFSADWQDVEKARYDVVLAANVFHHIDAKEIPMWLKRCRDVLTPNGRFFLFEHNPFNPLTRYVFERCVFDKDATMIPLARMRESTCAAGMRLIAAEY